MIFRFPSFLRLFAGPPRSKLKDIRPFPGRENDIYGRDWIVKLHFEPSPILASLGDQAYDETYVRYGDGAWFTESGHRVNKFLATRLSDMVSARESQ